MDTWTITGNITDAQGNPTTYSGLAVSLNDKKLVNHKAIGKEVEGSSYSIGFGSSWFKKWFGPPDLVVTLWAPGHRAIAQRSLGKLDAGTHQADFKVHPLHVNGLLVTLPLADASKDPDGNPVHGP